MVEYSRVSPGTYGLRHNAKRAADRVPGAVVFQEDGQWRWGVPVGAEDGIAQQRAADAAVFEQDAAAFEETDAGQEGIGDDSTPGLTEALADDSPAAAPGPEVSLPPPATHADPVQASCDTAAPPERPTLFATEDIILSARNVAGQPGLDPVAAWLLREMADRLSAPPLPRARAPRSAEPKADRKPRAAVPMDPANPPVIHSPTNQGVQRLIGRVYAARGNLDALRAFTFKPSSTYYALAFRYLEACLAEAEAGDTVLTD